MFHVTDAALQIVASFATSPDDNSQLICAAERILSIIDAG